jgi:hypothetical protein
MTNETKNTLPQGILISGICKGVREDVYNGNANYYVGFDVTYKDSYGQQQTSTEEISVFGENQQIILNKARSSVGKHCVISCNKRALKSERTGNAYMRTMIIRSSDLLVLN